MYDENTDFALLTDDQSASLAGGGGWLDVGKIVFTIVLGELMKNWGPAKRGMIEGWNSVPDVY